MPIDSPGHLHITIDHDAGRARVERTMSMYQGGTITINGHAYPARDVELREVLAEAIIHEPQCPDRA